MRESSVTVALIYPAVLGTYGDSGNASVLTQRLRWRGYHSSVLPVGVSEPLPTQADLYLLGGGEDTAQTLAAERLIADGTLTRQAGTSHPIFAVCAGFQILGHTFLDGAGRTRRGLGLLDCRTYRPTAHRAVGELTARPLLPGPDPFPILTGFENHAGRTTLGPHARPLAVVDFGIGNGDGTEGAVQGSILATYAHGPVLARNPALADHLLHMVLGPLPLLDDSEEHALRRERLATQSRPDWRRLIRHPAAAAAAQRRRSRNPQEPTRRGAATTPPSAAAQPAAGTGP